MTYSLVYVDALGAEEFGTADSIAEAWALVVEDVHRFPVVCKDGVVVDYPEDRYYLEGQYVYDLLPKVRKAIEYDLTYQDRGNGTGDGYDPRKAPRESS